MSTLFLWFFIIGIFISGSDLEDRVEQLENEIERLKPKTPSDGSITVVYGSPHIS